MPGEQITCREFVGFVGDYRDGELPAAPRWLFEAHLDQCQKCREYLKAYGATIQVGQGRDGELRRAGDSRRVGEGNPPLSASATELRFCARPFFQRPRISLGRGPTIRTPLRTDAELLYKQSLTLLSFIRFELTGERIRDTIAASTGRVCKKKLIDPVATWRFIIPRRKCVSQARRSICSTARTPPALVPT